LRYCQKSRFDPYFIEKTGEFAYNDVVLGFLIDLAGKSTTRDSG
jgi:hypothetical protein